MIRSSKALVAALLFAAGSHAASVDPALPAYAPRPFELPRAAPYLKPGGAIAVVGYNDMQDMMRSLTAKFTAAHPKARFALDLRGTRFAPEALAVGASAFAPMGALFTPPQLDAFRERAGHEPIAFRVAHASVDPRALSGPLAVFVHRDNPIASLTLGQVERIFTGAATRWADVGLEGAWAGRDIHALGMQRGTALAFEMRGMALGGRDFGDGMAGFAQSAQVVERVAADSQSIGFAAAMRSTAGVRAVPIARAGLAPVAPTAEEIVAGRYPLDRHLYMYASRPLSPLAREFLRLVLSREGQETVAASPQGYLPLAEREAAIEREKLD